MIICCNLVQVGLGGHGDLVVVHDAGSPNSMPESAAPRTAAAQRADRTVRRRARRRAASPRFSYRHRVLLRTHPAGDLNPQLVAPVLQQPGQRPVPGIAGVADIDEIDRLAFGQGVDEPLAARDRVRIGLIKRWDKPGQT